MRPVKFKKVPTIAFLCLLPILLSLGFWQMDRAEQKKQLLVLQKQRQSSDVIKLTGNSRDSVEDLLYKPVQIAGKYDTSYQILQNNQISDGKAGYFVLTPLIIQNSDKAVLVNRGWIPYPADQNALPDFTVAKDKIDITGQVNRFSRPGIILAGADKPTKSWPTVVQVINTTELGKSMGYDLLNYQIELDKYAEQGFKRNWQHPLAMPPEKHIAYAVQWFLLALTLLVLFIIYGIEKNNAESA